MTSIPNMAIILRKDDDKDLLPEAQPDHPKKKQEKESYNEVVHTLKEVKGCTQEEPPIDAEQSNLTSKNDHAVGSQQDVALVREDTFTRDGKIQKNGKLREKASTPNQKNRKEKETCSNTRKRIRLSEKGKVSEHTKEKQAIKVPTQECRELQKDNEKQDFKPMTVIGFKNFKIPIRILTALMFSVVLSQATGAPKIADQNNPYGFKIYNPNFYEVCLKWVDTDDERPIVITFCPAGLQKDGSDCRIFNSTLDMSPLYFKRFDNDLHPSTTYQVSVKLDGEIIFVGAMQTETKIPGVPQNITCIRLHDNKGSVDCNWDPPAQARRKDQEYLFSVKRNARFSAEKVIKGQKYTFQDVERTVISARIRAFNIFKGHQALGAYAETTIKEREIPSTLQSLEDVHNNTKVDEVPDSLWKKVLVPVVAAAVVVISVIAVVIWIKRQQRKNRRTAKEATTEELTDLTEGAIKAKPSVLLLVKGKLARNWQVRRNPTVITVA